MRLTNDEGTPVDPVPFIVTAAVAFLLLFSFAPGYLLSVGIGLPAALGATTATFAVAAALAYHRLVRRARPVHREEVPAAVRFRRLVYGVLVAIAAMLLLLAPVVLR